MLKKLGIAAIMLVLTSVWANCHAQQYHTVEFAYDLDGNRARREILIHRIGENNRNEDANNKYWPSVTDVFEKMEVSLYPNPTMDQIFVEIKGGTSNNTEAVLTLVSGSVLETKIIKSPTESFDLSKLPPGIYLLKLTVDKETHVWKVVKK